MTGLRPLPLAQVAGLLEGAVDVRWGADGFQPVRLTEDAFDFCHPSLSDAFTAEAAAGVRLRLRTTARHLALTVAQDVPARFLEGGDPGPELAPPVRYDLVVDGQLFGRVPADHAGDPQRLLFSDLPPGTKVVEVWLSQSVGVSIRGLAVDADASVESVPDESPRWVVYGSSITHGSTAAGPSATWPAVAARALGWHLTSLGFRGGCHLDPYVARVIAGLPADRITLKLGINVHNGQTLRERTFAPIVHGFVQTIRDAHPTTPIEVISPIYSVGREDSSLTTVPVPGSERLAVTGDLSLVQMRDILEEVVETRRRHGDAAIAYFEGPVLLGEADQGHLADGLHPDATGLVTMGERYATLNGRTRWLTEVRRSATVIPGRVTESAASTADSVT